MPFIANLGLNRRDILKAGAICAVSPLSAAPALAAGRPGASVGLATVLRPSPARVHMVGAAYPATEVWVSRIALFDEAESTDFDGLPASASRLL